MTKSALIKLVAAAATTIGGPAVLWVGGDYIALRDASIRKDGEIETLKTDNARLWEYTKYLHGLINEGRRIDGQPLSGPPAFSR